MAKRKQQKVESGAPRWVVTYGDMMSLLLCFFVMLVAMSEIKEEDKFKDVVQSMQEAFGFVGGMGRVPTLDPPTVSLLQKLENIVVPREVNKIGDSHQEGVEEIWIALKGDITLLLGKHLFKLPVGAAYKIPENGICAHANINASEKQIKLMHMMHVPVGAVRRLR